MLQVVNYSKFHYWLSKEVIDRVLLSKAVIDRVLLSLIVDFEEIPHKFLVFPMLTLNK